MKLKSIVLVAALALAGCSHRTVGGPEGYYGPNPNYQVGTHKFNNDEWFENSTNKLVYHLTGSRSGYTQKIYVDFRYNGLQLSTTASNAGNGATCHVQLYAADESMVDDIKINVGGSMVLQDRYLYGRAIDYAVFIIDGYLGTTEFVLESYAR